MFIQKEIKVDVKNILKPTLVRRKNSSLSVLFLLFFSFFTDISCCHDYTVKKESIDAAICHHNTLKINLPVRYLFIQLTEWGQNITDFELQRDNSVVPTASNNCSSKNKKKNDKLIKYWVEKDEKCRIKDELVDNFDGTFVFRFRIILPCRFLKINLVLGLSGQHLCRSPILIDDRNLLNPEECACNQEKLEDSHKWFDKHCPADSIFYSQLYKDMEQFPVIDFDRVLSRVESKWGHENQSRSAALCRYKIDINNQISKHCYGEYTGFSIFMDDVLKSLSKKMKLPEMDFIQNLGDWPLETDPKSPVPITSWCGSTATADIVLPTYEMMDSTLKSMHQLSRDIQNVQGDHSIPWEEKFNKAIFRGRDSNILRIKAAKLSQKYPELINAGITRYFFFHDDSNPNTVHRMNFDRFFDYKYILSIDGTVAAYRLPYLLSGNSVVVKQESPFYEHFYSLMQPNVHFLSFKDDDLLHLLTALPEMDQRALQKVSKTGKEVVRNHLQPLNLFCYHVKFLNEYSSRFSPPTIDRFVNQKMEQVTAPKSPKYCGCDSKTEL